MADSICELIADGNSLVGICAAKSMPHRATVFRWLAAYEEFRDMYARAREAQADALVDDTLHIADTQQIGEKRTIKADGAVEVVEADMIEHRRLRIEARKWAAAKLAPKKYGDKIEVENRHSLAPELASWLDQRG